MPAHFEQSFQRSQKIVASASLRLISNHLERRQQCHERFQSISESENSSADFRKRLINDKFPIAESCLQSICARVSDWYGSCTHLRCGHLGSGTL